MSGFSASGAANGAAQGASVGGGWGAAIGGVLGAFSGGGEPDTPAVSSAKASQIIKHSGWTVGLGNAKVNAGSSIPWFVWAGLAVVGIVIIKEYY